MISGEKVLSWISALTNIRSPYSASKSGRKGEASMAMVHACKYSWSWGMAPFQKVSSPS